MNTVTGKSIPRWAGVALLVVFGFVSACVPNANRTDLSVRNADAQGGVVIKAPEGPPGPMAALLAQSVADALVRRGYAARSETANLSVKEGADFYVTGKAEALDHIHAPTVAALHWVLYDARGKEIAYLTQGVRGNPDSWEYGSPAMLRIVGEEAAADFSVFLGYPPNQAVTPSFATLPADGISASATEPASQILGSINEDSMEADGSAVSAIAPLPSPPSPPPLTQTSNKLNKQSFGLWLDEVTGAPGNGNAALTQAIYTDLKHKALPFALSPGLASHYVQGVVDVAVRSAAQEHVTIIWVVSNASGKEIGRVTQRNDIARGSLHGDWGDTAIYAARGGIEGILAILERDLETALEN